MNSEGGCGWDEVVILSRCTVPDQKACFASEGLTGERAQKAASPQRAALKGSPCPFAPCPGPLGDAGVSDETGRAGTEQLQGAGADPGARCTQQDYERGLSATTPLPFWGSEQGQGYWHCLH